MKRTMDNPTASDSPHYERRLGNFVSQNPLAVITMTAATAATAYHGYKRTESVGWALGWALFGAVLPIVAVPVALAQGYGEPK